MKNILFLLLSLCCLSTAHAQTILSNLLHPIHTDFPYENAVVGDFDGDGLDEVAAVSKTIADHALIHIFEVSAVGELQPLQTFKTGIFFPAPLAIDVDEDGDLDLVYGSSPDIIWHENLGNGLFSEQQNPLINLSSGTTGWITFDFDNDGDQDILLKNIGDKLYENINGNFELKQTFFYAGSSPYYFPIDLDGDDDLDIIQSISGGIVFFYNETDGFASADTITTSVPFLSGRLAAGDLDADGDVDLAVVGNLSQQVYFVYNDGDNQNFSNHEVQPYGFQNNTSAANAQPYLFDVENDGDLDVLMGHQDETSVAWFRNNSGNFTSQFLAIGEIDLLEKGEFLPLEFNGEAGLELLFTGYQKHRLQTFQFQTATEILTLTDTHEPITNNIFDVHFSDMDGDGDEDLVTLNDNNHNITWLERNAAMENLTPHTIQSYEYGITIGNAVADFSGDGFPDVMFSERFTSNPNAYLQFNQPGTGDFSTPELLGEANFTFVPFDMDGDGDQDLLTQSVSGTNFSLLENTDGNGDFSPPIPLFENAENNFYPTGTLPTDIDNDGDLDVLIFTNHSENGLTVHHISLFRNDGSGNFSAPEMLHNFGKKITPGDLQLEDLNGDGWKDVVYLVYDVTLTEIGVLAGNSVSDDFAAAQIIYNGNDPGTGINSKFHVADIDLDGDLDIFPNAEIWHRNEANSGEFTAIEYTWPLYANSLLGLQDLDADGDLDFILQEPYQIYWLENTAIHNFWLEGTIWADENSNCTLDSAEIGLSEWVITATSDNYDFVQFTDTLGQYRIAVDSGEWFVNALPKSAFWAPCFEDSLLIISGIGGTFTTDFFMQPNGECGFLDWQITTEELRPCQPNILGVQICNFGVEAYEDLILEVMLDEIMTLDSASTPFSLDSDGTLFFDVGTLAVDECENITIYTFADCDSLILFDLHCAKFRLLPEEICAPFASNWDGSTIEVDGTCDQDSITFTLQNIGTGNMSTPAQFRLEIINDDIVMLMLTDSFQLNTGETLELKYPKQGMGLRLSADQTPENPISNEAAVIVPNCDDIANNIILSWLPTDDGNPFVTIACLPVSNSYDPNDKQATPRGIGDNHEIEKDWELNYKIRFQNTGNDTAYLVVLRDTISEYLDLTTLRMLGSSHSYSYELSTDRELKIIFDDIGLVDSLTNPAGSQGFVNYAIKPKADILTGTIIENTAAIYFDFNPPIFTNTTFHQIRRHVVASSEQWFVCADEGFETDTVLVEEMAFLEYDSLHFIHVFIADSEMELDTAVAVGTIYQDVLIEGDTSFTQIFENQYGCDSLVHFNVSIINSTHSIEFQQVRIYPNPVKSTIYIENHWNGKPQNWKLINATGQVIWEQNLKENQSLNAIKTEQIPSGVYWLQVTSEGALGVWRVVKY